MFKNVLVVDDHASVNYGIVEKLKKDTAIQQIIHTQNCDDAYLKFQKAIKDNNPFDLVIIDLVFKTDYISQTIKTGLDLIKKLRKKQPKLKVIIYSVEDRPSKIKITLERHKVNGFVSKGRHGLKELLEAINSVWKNKTYTSKKLELDTNFHFEITDFDIMILQKLANGISQKEIASQLQQKSLKRNSLSSIEKDINKLKVHFKANNPAHLVAICKDLGLI